MKRFAAAILLCLAVCSTGCFAEEAVQMVSDAQVEKRVQLISDELRCLVCQGESLAQSGAGLAQDLRREIRNQIKASKSDQEVINFMVGRYGDFVLYQPKLKVAKYLLRFGPGLLLVVCLGALVRYLLRRGKPAQQMVD